MGQAWIFRRPRRVIPQGINKVLLTGGHETGGLRAYASALAEGFEHLGLACTVVAPSSLRHHLAEVRDPDVLKIFSTSAVFMAPFARSVVSVAHGFPRPDAQGWPRTLAILASFKLLNQSTGCPLVAVSDYVAVHLRAVYDLRVDAVIRNPVKSLFTEPWEQTEQRRYLTYAGRLHPAKNVHRLIPIMLRLLDEDPRLRICIVGDGPHRRQLESLVRGDPRVEFRGILASRDLRTLLRQTRVFVSGNETEPFGITYIEALSQGCGVAMPACGGGIEIATDLVGSQIVLLPLSFDPDTMLERMRRANDAPGVAISMEDYLPEKVAASYLRLVSKG